MNSMFDIDAFKFACEQTCLEFFLALQTITDSGLQSAEVSEQRLHVKPIQNSSADLCDALEKDWRKRSVHDAFQKLSKGDIQVTNQSDKSTQLAKLRQLDQMMKNPWGRLSEELE